MAKKVYQCKGYVGPKFQRKTDRTYTHAIVANKSVAVAFCGSAGLANKALNSWNSCNRQGNYEIVEVECIKGG